MVWGGQLRSGAGRREKCWFLVVLGANIDLCGVFRSFSAWKKENFEFVALVLEDNRATK